MPLKRRGLGRGLDALLGDLSTATRDEKYKTQCLPIEFMQCSKYQPRKNIDSEKLQELANSIRTQGIVQPIIVRKIDQDKYEIIAGERRWRAAQLAQLADVPVVIKDIDDRTAIAMALIENIQREDLNSIEEAESLQKLGNEFVMTHQQIAQAVGKSRATVTNLLRLIDLQPKVKTMLQAGYLEMGHARALLGLQGEEQIVAAKKVVSAELTVRSTEKLVRDVHKKPTKKVKVIDLDTQRLQEKLSTKLGTKVAINHQNNGKGKLIISYSSLDELDGVLQRIN